MKTSIFLLTGLLLMSTQMLFSQTQLNLNLGYLTEKSLRPGAVIGLELERQFTPEMSLPLRADLGFLQTADFEVLSLEVSTGFRRYFDNGLFVEQSVGLAVAGTMFEPGGVWYMDKYENVIAYQDGLNWGVAPAVTAGLGYQLNEQHMFWARPKVYWNLLIRGLDRPYTSLQIGYTYKFQK
jgi:hypothetical protein